MTRYGPILAAVAVLVVAGLLGGVAERPGSEAALRAAAGRAARLPRDLGAWEGRPGEIDLRPYGRMGIAGGASRVYLDRRTGAAVSVLLVCGSPGPIAVHTPDICLAAAGFEPEGTQARIRVAPPGGGPAAEFFRCRFRKAGAAVPAAQVVYWAWGDDRAWGAPERPRISYAGRPALFKLYLTRAAGPSAADDPRGDEAVVELIARLLPELGRALWPIDEGRAVSAPGRDDRSAALVPRRPEEAG